MSVGPVYGAPLGALPAGSSWGSVRAMLSEAFLNVRHAWVHDFLFNPDPRLQAHLLTSPDNMCNSMAFTQRVYSDPGTVPAAAAFDKLMVALLVPACVSDGLVAKVMVESHTSSEIIVRRTDRVVQAIGDPANGSNLTVSIDEERGCVEMWYERTCTSGDRMFVMAVFREAELRRATRLGCVDVDAVQRALTSTLIGTEPVQPGEKRIMAGDVDAVGDYFPGRDNVTSGEWYSKTMLGMYSDNGTLIFSAPYGMIMSRSFGVAAQALQQMQNWGVRDRLCRLKISIPFEIPYVQHGAGDVSPNNGYQQSASSSSRNINININIISQSPSPSPPPYNNNAKERRTGLPLAPREHQVAPALNTAENNGELTYAQKADLEYEAKMERKRQRNRLAAARSNAKKSAERKKRRAAGGNVTSTDVNVNVNIGTSTYLGSSSPS